MASASRQARAAPGGPRAAPRRVRQDTEREIGRLGQVVLARLARGGGEPARGLALPGGAEPGYAFLLQVRGAGALSQLGRTAALGQGDLTLCDCASPHAYEAGAPGELLAALAPAAALREHLPSPEAFCGRRLAAGEGLADSARDLLASICAQLQAGIPGDAGARVGRNLLDMLATAFAASFDSVAGESPVMSGRQARVRQHIEERLRDPDLSPAAIAASLKLSPRYLRMIFGAGGETVSAYILRRRLEECARELADPRLAHLSITEVAFGWGFNSAPHFSRSFSEQIGVSPRVWRQAAREQGAGNREQGVE